MVELTEPEARARERVCLPLDGLQDMGAVEQRVQELSPVVGLFKVGKETYTRFGYDAVHLVQNNGSNVFLDLKYHDIPNTVYGAAKAAAEHEVYMFNVHAAGGYEMMRAARDGVRDGAASSQPPKILGVTVLTSLDTLRYIHNNLGLIEALPSFVGDYSDEIEKLGELSPLRQEVERVQTIGGALNDLLLFPYEAAIDMQILIAKEKDPHRKEALQEEYQINYGIRFDTLIEEAGLEDIIPMSVNHFAKMAADAGLDGIVSSAEDLDQIGKTHHPKDFMYVTPGIAAPGSTAGSDQQRVFTPGNALKNGSTILVAGRTITKHKTPEERIGAAHAILKDMAPYV